MNANIMTKILIMLALAATNLVQVAPPKHPENNRNLYSEKVYSPAAESQPCYRDDCADRRLLSVTLPRGAAYTATHYFTNAEMPNDLADVREVSLVDVAYSHFSPAEHHRNAHGEEVVTVYYYNRSNRNRHAQISVDYTE